MTETSDPVMATEAKRIIPPFGDQIFRTYGEWVTYASRVLTHHPEYNNTEHGEDAGWRGRHFTAMMFDSLGRPCRNGAEIKRAEVDGTFPLWWVWPDQIIDLVIAATPRDEVGEDG